MPTVLDTLTVELGLDPRPFQEGGKDALDAMHKLKSEGTGLGQVFIEQQQKIADVFSTLKSGALGIVGAFVGSEAAGFLNHVANMTAETSRFSESIGANFQNLTLWQAMVRHLGGTAEEATAAFSGMNQVVENIKFGEVPKGLLGNLLIKSGAFNQAFGPNAPENMMRTIADYLGRERAAGNLSAADVRRYLEAIPGIQGAEHMIYLLQEGPQGIKKTAEEVAKLGLVNKEAGDTAREFQSAVADLDVQLERAATQALPPFAAALKTVNDVLSGPSGGLIKSILGGVGAGYVLGGVPGAVAGAVTAATAYGLSPSNSAVSDTTSTDANGNIVGTKTIGGFGASRFATFLRNDPNASGIIHHGNPARAAARAEFGAQPETPAGDGGQSVSPSPSSKGGLSANILNFLNGLSFLESDFRTDAVSKTGARGAFQFTRGTAADAVKAGIGDPRIGSWMEQALKAWAFIKRFHPEAASAIERGDYDTAIGILRVHRFPSLPGGDQYTTRADRQATFRSELAGGGPKPPGFGVPAGGTTIPGDRVGGPGNANNTHVSVGDIHVQSSKADPKEVAEEIPAAIRRSFITGGANTGLA